MDSAGLKWPSGRQAASWLVLLYIAISLSVLISQQAGKIATSHTHNPYLFTAHLSPEVYRTLDDAFKPRLFAYLLVAPFVDLDLEASKPGSLGRISVPAFERLVKGWSFVWMLGVLTLLLGTDRPLLYMLGTSAGVSFAYGLQGMVYPYDLPALFFATLIFVLILRGQTKWLPLTLGVGVGFKETLAVFSLIAYFLDGSRKERLRAVGICLLACFWVIMAIDLYSGRSLFGFEAVTSVGDRQNADRFKLLLNLPLALDPSSLTLCVNAGLALPLLLIPAKGNRLALGFRCIGIVFAVGLFALAKVDEYRIWFEIIPLCLYNITTFLDPATHPANRVDSGADQQTISASVRT